MKFYLYIFVFSLIVGLLIVSVLWLRNQYKKSNTIDEKLSFIIIVLVFVIPLIIYYIDRFNLPSKIGLIKPYETERWFNFISTYIYTILGALISALILILITFHEFNNVRNSDKEQRRIDSMPLFEYDFYISYHDSPKYSYNLCNNNDTRALNIVVGIRNIGMNTVRKCYVSLSSKYIKNCFDYKVDQQEIIKKDDKKSLNFRIPIFSKNEKVTFKIKYQDILFNWYIQNVEVYLDNIYFNDDYRTVKADIRKNVCDEKVVVSSLNLKIK